MSSLGDFMMAASDKGLIAVEFSSHRQESLGNWPWRTGVPWLLRCDLLRFLPNGASDNNCCRADRLLCAAWRANEGLSGRACKLSGGM